MAYKNLFFRLIFSLLFFVLYFVSLTQIIFLFIFGLAIYLLIFIEVIFNFKKLFNIIIIYLLTSLACFSLYFFLVFDYFFFNLLVFSIIIFDTMSFFSGTVFGKNYIFKKISPKKTLEGYLGGIFITNIIVIFFLSFIQSDQNILNFVIYINSIIFFAIIGDLIESFFKRRNNIKDSSQYIPGHGGFFDRFDSFIAAIIFLTINSFI